MNRDYDELFFLLLQLFIIFCLIFLISSREVKAASVSNYSTQMIPKGLFIDGDNYSFTSVLDNGNRYIKTPQFSYSPSKYQFLYDFSSLKSYKYISFIIQSYSSPVVFANGNACTITYSYNRGYNIVSDTPSNDEFYEYDAIGGIYGVVCYNPGNDSNIELYYGGGTPGVSHSVVMISQFFNFYDSEDITGAIQDVNDKVGEVKDAIEGDNLDTGSIESSSNESFNAYNDAESNLNLGKVDLSGINLGLNPTVASKTWSTLQSFINTNPKLMTFFVSMLSIGLIKLFLGR